MMLALKIDVATLIGLRQGVPALIEVLQKHNVEASFLLNLGNDETRALIRSVFVPGLRKKITALTGNKVQGLSALTSSYWFPKNLGLFCGEVLQHLRGAGFEVGILTYDPVAWHGVRLENADASCSALKHAFTKFQELVGESPAIHASGEWRINHHALRLTQGLGLNYSSDARGISPFLPLFNAEIVACPQVPTTLPTLDEVIKTEAESLDTIIDRLRTADQTHAVYTARAELEGLSLLPIFEKLVVRWRELGLEIVSLTRYMEEMNKTALSRHNIVLRKLDTRKMVFQGREFLEQDGKPPEIFPTWEGQLEKITDLSQLKVEHVST